MTSGARTDEHDAEPLAQLGELGPLGDEPPSDPRRVGTRRDAAPAPSAREVEVRDCPRRAADRSSMHTASSASRTNIADCSARVCRAIDRMSAPRSYRSSRTALTSRIAASPRFTMAMRRSPRSIGRQRT